MKTVGLKSSFLVLQVVLVCLVLLGCSPPSTDTTIVPNVVGLSQAAAESAITSAGLVVGTVNSAYSSSVSVGNVIGQDPASGTSVLPGTSVNLVVSLGLNPGEGEGESEGGGCDGCTTETIMLPGNVPLEMVWIEPGTFMMGRYSGEQGSLSDEDPQHQVTLTQGFWMSKYELTKAQWTAVMGTTPWSGQDWVLDDTDSPAIYVSWNDAQAFFTALETLTGKTFRLPSEAEWEYACRAGTTTRFYWGDDLNYTVSNDYAWWAYNAWDVGEQYAHVVGQKLPNAFGLYDMSGNVWEWCNDWYGSYSSGSATDPTGPASGSYRLVRGGSLSNSDGIWRSANRNGYTPDASYHNSGFRVLRTP